MASVSSCSRAVPSLSDIMSEQLADKLQSNSETDVDPDYELALRLSLETNGGGNVHEPYMTEDMLMAMRLQEVFDREAVADRIHAVEQRANNFSPASKVSLSFQRFQPHPAYVEDVEEYYEYEEDEEPAYEFGEGEKAFLADVQLYRESHGPQHTRGRGLSYDSIVTKHDPQVDSRRNVRQIEQTDLDTGNFEGLTAHISQPVAHGLTRAARKVDRQRVRRHRREEIATTERVLDPKTRVMVMKMLSNGTLREMHGVISSGKEANVYHAIGAEEFEGQQLAVKIFKTTLNEFKNRAEYVEGDIRFPQKPSTNPRKLIKLWAEKEFKNLHRLQECGIPSPTPILLRKHVLIMSLIGTSDGHPAPQLKEATWLSSSRIRDFYMQIVKHMRTLYHTAKLVHGDLSEYNILCTSKTVYFIDVAQAVERNHPYALKFLRQDCKSITSFFQSKGLPCVMSVRRLFNFVTDLNVSEENMDEYLTAVQKEISEMGGVDHDEHEDAFMMSFIPSRLSEVDDVFNDHECVQDGEVMFHSSVNGMKEDLSGATSHPSILKKAKRKAEKEPDISCDVLNK